MAGKRLLVPISLWITSRDLLSRSPRVHLSFRYRAAAEAISPFVNLFLAISDTRIAILHAVDVAIEATRLIRSLETRLKGFASAFRNFKRD